ncbi:Dihydropteroate synthase [Chlamydiales bacterium SCGC AG-110-M15]|nr:Dihydropteroate synthase [Chlamydiales bacterium SCGC AG-110-M15]
MTKVKLMGALNVSPDSFYQGFHTVDSAVQRGLEMVQDGADIIDIGGESTRPYAAEVSESEELARVLPVIKSLRSAKQIELSIDTRKPKVATAALDLGVDWINDVEGFRNPAMRDLAASSEAKICVMHMLHNPQTMQDNPHYESGIVPHLMQWFEKRVNLLIQSGIKEDRITLDPGIGFGKTVEDNLQILNSLSTLKSLGFPILIGLSRKSFIGKILDNEPKDRLPATIAANALIMKNVDIIRVHDVKEHRGVIDFATRFHEESSVHSVV